MLPRSQWEDFHRLVWASGVVGPGICRGLVSILGGGAFKIHRFQECCYTSLRIILFFRELYRGLWMVVTGLHDLTEQEYRQVL